MTELHPAIVRPGRCIAQIEIGRLTPAESRAWVAASAGRERRGSPVSIEQGGATLAELHALEEAGVKPSFRRPTAQLEALPWRKGAGQGQVGRRAAQADRE
ncbi:MAG: hypothetical protein ACRD2W_00275 [Acidimicrobiales bacterium]